MAVATDQYRDDLLPAIAGHHVEGTAPRRSADRGGHILQATIPGLVAIAVVVGLEVVDVDQQYRDRDVRDPGVLPQVPRLLLQSGTIEQPGEPVVHRHL